MDATHSFGSGANSFTMDFVTIGNPGNRADGNGWGSVASTFLMGKHEVSEQMIRKANTLGKLGITLDNRMAGKPATSVSWNQAARFVNWLNVSKGKSPAYKFATQPGEFGYDAHSGVQPWTEDDPGYDAANLLRNANAVYFLPSDDEWYKAAYYAPKKPGGSGYYLYPTGSDRKPAAVASGTDAGTAVYGHQTGPADIFLAGGLSPYGTMGQAGNAWEWTEGGFRAESHMGAYAQREKVSARRMLRGGSWDDYENHLQSSHRFTTSDPTFVREKPGFRVGSRPWRLP